MHCRDLSCFSRELYLTYQHRVPASCKTAAFCLCTLTDALQAQQISQTLLPAERHSDSMSYLRPIISTYKDNSYDGMRTAIFPSYFHGKCQRNGVDPPGCPNPDCPVVCGTPGSLVHFYPTLRFIAYNHTRSSLQRLCSPGNDAYERVERAVVQAASGYHKRGGEQRRVPWFEYVINGRGR